jgi:hypothetical protein
MSITNYTELKTAIADFLIRDDLTAVIPTFISLSEAQMQRDIRSNKMMARSQAQIDTRYLQLPTDWVETIRLHIADDTGHRLELTSLDDMLQERQSNNGGGSGKPSLYAHIGTSLEVYPEPQQIYDLELMYYQKIPALSVAAPTNWLLADAPDVYLYGALMQSAPYLSDDARMQVWGQLYASATAAINARAEEARYSGTGLRMRIRSY